MLFQGIEFAKILTTKQEDFEFLKSKYQNTGVVVDTIDLKNIKPSEIPIIVIGRETSSIIDKDTYNIFEFFDSDIKSNQTALNKLNYILEKIAYTYSPYEYLTYDAILDGDFFTFLNGEIDTTQEMYLYFHKKALYLYCSGKMIAINLETIQYISGNAKKIIETILNEYKCFIFSFSNFKKYINVIQSSLITFENIVWSKYSIEIEEKDLFNHFGGFSIYKHIPYLMSVFNKQNVISSDELFSIKRYYRKDLITDWLSSQTVFFNTKVDGFNLKSYNKLFYTRFNYSNKRTITGRINIFDDQVNLQMLPKTSEIRNHIVSRYKKGKIVVFDYVSFEFKIAIFATGDFNFIEKFENEDMHNYVAKIIFKKQTVSSGERGVAKLFNHTLLFGGGEEKLKSIIQNYDSSLNFIEIYNQIMFELKPIVDDFSSYITQQLKDFGYFKNAYGVIVRPRKEYASLNNFTQSTASDIVVEKLYLIKDFISNKEIHFLYQVYDSFIMDFDESELHLINDIENILSEANKVKFLVDHKIGSTLMECGHSEAENLEQTK